VRRRVLSGHPLPEPAAVHLGHVAHQPQQRQRGGLHGATGQVGGIKTGALQFQRGTLTAQELNQSGALAAQGRPA